MNLKYETHKFNRYDALVNMIRLELYKHPCTDAKSLIVEEWLLYYVYAHILSHCDGEYPPSVGWYLHNVGNET